MIDPSLETDAELRNRIFKANPRLRGTPAAAVLNIAQGANLDHVVENLGFFRGAILRHVEIKLNVNYERACDHVYVNVGFSTIKMACRFCGADQ